MTPLIEMDLAHVEHVLLLLVLLLLLLLLLLLRANLERLHLHALPLLLLLVDGRLGRSLEAHLLPQG